MITAPASIAAKTIAIMFREDRITRTVQYVSVISMIDGIWKVKVNVTFDAYNCMYGLSEGIFSDRQNGCPYLVTV